MNLARLLPRLIAAFIILIMLLGCSCTTKPETGKLTGSVTLFNDSGNTANDPVDFSGISITLYDEVPLDSTITRANFDYPHIGIIISQETEFDHREHTPKYSSVTDASGNFSIDGVSPGDYNIVVSKEEWGWRYLYNCRIVSGANYLGELIPASRESANLSLYPQTIIQGTSTIGLLLRDHTYLVDSSATVINDLVMQNGANLLLNPSANLTIIGDFSTSIIGSPSFSKLILGGDEITDKTFGKIQIQGNSELSNVIFDRTNSGLQFVNGSVNLTNCRGKNSLSGITIINCEPVVISNVVLSDIGELTTSGANIYTTQGGVDMTSCLGVTVDKSIFTRCNSGVKIRQICTAVVSDCFFAYNTIGAEAQSDQVRFEHNTLENNYTYDFRVFNTECSPQIVYNSCFSKRGINIGLDTHPANMDCTPLISYNNFSCQVFAIRVIGYNTIDISAPNNFFYTTDIDTIEQLIWDQDDYTPGDWSNYIISNTAHIDFIPFAHQLVAGAGIRS